VITGEQLIGPLTRQYDFQTVLPAYPVHFILGDKHGLGQGFLQEIEGPGIIVHAVLAESHGNVVCSKGAGCLHGGVSFIKIGAVELMDMS